VRQAVRRFDAVIFDMDGVIADSEPAHEAAFNAVLAPSGHAIVPELQQRFMGHGLQESWQALIEHFGLTETVGVLLQRYEIALLAALAEVHETLPGVREVIAGVKQRGLALAVASSSWEAWIAALLEGLGLTAQFDAIVSASHVTHTKPAPDIYLLAASTLHAEPSRCLVIEDTPAGVASAKSAGMFCVQTRSASSAFPPIDGADLVLNSLLDLDLALLD
jgi:HAD superfamily hydrolase (TIGR01509 family)